MTNPVDPYLLPGLLGLLGVALVLIAAHRWDVGEWPQPVVDPDATARRRTWIKVSLFALVLVATFVWAGDVVTASSGGGTGAGGGAALSPGVGAAAGEQIFWGAGKCATCHSVGTRGGKIRGPNLGISPVGDPIGLRAAALAAQRAATLGRPMTAAEYLVESIADPSASLSQGYKDEMPKPYLPPISLTPDQITSVILYLQSLGGTPDPAAIHLPPEITQAAQSRVTVDTWKPYLVGDSARGHEIFFDARGPSACARCHRVGGRGAGAGSDLGAIGATHTPRSIVELLVGPTRRHDSLLPGGFVARINVKDFHDLLAFLETLRPYVAGDTARGRALFFDETGRAACAKCHRLGNRGGDAGPEITAVVAIRTSTFLLEAILKPSKHIASGYQTVQIRTNDNRTLQGVVVRETPDSVWLGTSDGGHVTVPLRAIVQRRAVDASLMPDTLAKMLSAKDLGDLMAFLETLR